MLSLRPLASSALALLGLAATLGQARTAHAADNKTISTKVSFGTDQLFDELVVEATGVLQVAPVIGGGQGKIHIRARKITVKTGGKITASGVGYPGVNAADGQAAAGSGGGGKVSSVAGEPGGGGGYVSAGASGANKDCMPLPGAAGGNGFAMPTPEAPILGSAGGAAKATSLATAGGNGGGVIILEAAEILIDGTVEADGDSPSDASGIARGGGSGGFIAIIAAQLSGSGTIFARGGSGTAAPGVPPMNIANHGGGGAGGAIYLKARAMPSLKADVSGGATGNCAPLKAADGPTPERIEDATFCVDADRDKHFAESCGGDDCNDSVDTTYLDAPEVCNGRDDNCNDKVDEGATICAAGSTCDATEKKCVDSSDGGTDAGPPVDAGSPPDHLAFESGCSIGDGADPLGALTLAGLGVGALVMRRRRAEARR